MEPFTAVVLAGGRSQRMGQDKVWLDAGGQPLIVRVVERLHELVAEVVVVRATPTVVMPPLPARIVDDRYRAAGPLAGLHAGLHAAVTPWVFALACDMPSLNPALVRYLALLRPWHDAVVPCPTGQPEPLHAFYHRRCLPAVEACLERGQRQLLAFYAEVRVRPVPLPEITIFDPNLSSFTNVNTPEEWADARKQMNW